LKGQDKKGDCSFGDKTTRCEWKVSSPDGGGHFASVRLRWRDMAADARLRFVFSSCLRRFVFSSSSLQGLSLLHFSAQP
jgi:hypothetical protein